MFKLPANVQPYQCCFIVNVTPEMARTWIMKNNFNRPVKQRLVDDYARQIEAGNWRRTHQGIAFDEEGVVLDGQHRLLAIIQSGKTVPMLIFTNENQASHESIDGGKKRSLLDVVRLELLDNTIKMKHLCVLKALWAGRFCKNQNHLTSTEIIAMYRRYHVAARFAVDMLDFPGIDDTTIMGVVARATYTVPREKLLEFCNILRSGTGDHPSAGVILEFKTWFDRLGDRQEATRREIYKRAESVLQAFLNSESQCELPRDHKEYFPLYSTLRE
jgi:hypothetical protein